MAARYSILDEKKKITKPKFNTNLKKALPRVFQNRCNANSFLWYCVCKQFCYFSRQIWCIFPEFWVDNILGIHMKLLVWVSSKFFLVHLTVTRLGLWHLMYHSWHKLHFYKKSNVAKCFFIYCTRATITRSWFETALEY